MWAIFDKRMELLMCELYDSKWVQVINDEYDSNIPNKHEPRFGKDPA